MKILHFKTLGLEQYGGVEMFIRHLPHANATRGCENTVLPLAKEPMKPATISSFRLVQAKRDLHIASTGFSWSSSGAFARLAKQADVILYHFP